MHLSTHDSIPTDKSAPSENPLRPDRIGKNLSSGDAPGAPALEVSAPLNSTAHDDFFDDGPFRYRPDVDGLRAVAVLGVVLFHMNPTWMPGGFVGVDIFFVISGFVVTGSLLRSALGRDSMRDYLLGFYARRFQRLTPALFVVVLTITLLLGVCVPRETESLGEYFNSGSFGMVGLANVYFATLPVREMNRQKTSTVAGGSSGGAQDEVERPADPVILPGYFDEGRRRTSPASSSEGSGAGAALGAVAVASSSVGLQTSMDMDSSRGHVVHHVHDFHRNPSLHLWSLGVEEQFYLVFPLLVAWGYFRYHALLPRRATRAVVIFSGLFAISLAASTYLSSEHPDQAFYQTPSRFWQLLAGAIVFELCRGRRQKPFPIPVLFLLDIGNFLLLGSALSSSRPDAGWPVPGAFCGTIGATLFLATGSVQRQSCVIGITKSFSLSLSFPIVNTLLASSTPVFLGKISYPLYLWHWPVFVFCKWRGGFDTVWQRLCAALVAYQLACFTYLWVEQPLRSWKAGRKHVFGCSFLAVGVVQLFVYTLRKPERREAFFGTSILGTGSFSSSFDGGLSISAALGRDGADEDFFGAQQVPLDTFANKSLVFIGDSLMKYQYLNLAYRVTHGVSPPFQFYEHAFFGAAESILRHAGKSEAVVSQKGYGGGNPQVEARWTNWFRASSHVLTHEEDETCSEGLESDVQGGNPLCSWKTPITKGSWTHAKAIFRTSALSSGKV